MDSGPWLGADELDVTPYSSHFDFDFEQKMGGC
jgi:hypothetical protein